MEIFPSELAVATKMVLLSFLQQRMIIYHSLMLALEKAKFWIRLSKTSKLHQALKKWKISLQNRRRSRTNKYHPYLTKSSKAFWGKTKIISRRITRKMAGRFFKKPFWTFLLTSSMTSLSLMGLSMDCQSFMKMLWCILRSLISHGKRIRWQSTTSFL